MASHVKNKKDKQHIHVYARLRPFNEQETATRAKKCVRTQEKKVIVDTSQGSKAYLFDQVFDEKSSQKAVYMTVIQPMVAEIVQGYNCTVFTYGQTGTGKTYSMIGRENVPNVDYTKDSDAGIIPRILEHLFVFKSQRPNLDCNIRISYVELYNEILIDLLSKTDKQLRIYECPRNKGSIQIQGLEEIGVTNRDQVLKLLEMGNERKIMAATQMNAHSSRSHTVFTITLHTREQNSNSDEVIKTGKLHLVDLAGSENVRRSGSVEKRAREAGSINQSLLALGRVIKALVEHSAHVPYRESKLTRLLQDSLGGKTKTSIIATLSPASINVEETLSTLEYAHRARHITTTPEVNQKTSKTALMSSYLDQIERLNRDLTAARSGIGVLVDLENYHGIMEESERNKEEILKRVEMCAGFENKIAVLEHTKKELEEVFNVTKVELDSATQSFNKAKLHTKQLLEEQRIHRDLIDKYEQAQTNLKHDRKLLMEALNTYFIDYNKLRDRVDDLYTVANENARHFEEFQAIYADQSKELDDKINQFAENLKHHTQSFHDSSVEYSSHILEGARSLKQKIVEQDEIFESEWTDANNKLVNMCDSRLNYFTNQNALSDHAKSKYLASITSMEKQHNIAQKKGNVIYNRIKNNLEKRIIPNGIKLGDRLMIHSDLQKRHKIQHKSFERRYDKLSINDRNEFEFGGTNENIQDLLKLMDNIENITLSNESSLRMSDVYAKLEEKVNNNQIPAFINEMKTHAQGCFDNSKRNHANNVLARKIAFSNFCEKMDHFEEQFNNETMQSVSKFDLVRKEIELIAAAGNERHKHEISKMESSIKKLDERDAQIHDFIHESCTNHLATVENYASSFGEEVISANEGFTGLIECNPDYKDELLKEIDENLKSVTDFTDSLPSVNSCGATPARKETALTFDTPDLPSRKAALFQDQSMETLNEESIIEISDSEEEDT